MTQEQYETQTEEQETTTLQELKRKLIKKAKLLKELHDESEQDYERQLKDIIIELGTKYANTTLKDEPHLICAQLKKDFAGAIDSDYVQEVSYSEWKEVKKTPGNKRQNAPVGSTLQEQPQLTCAQTLQKLKEQISLEYSGISNKDIREKIENHPDLQKFAKATLRKERPKILPISDEEKEEDKKLREEAKPPKNHHLPEETRAKQEEIRQSIEDIDRINKVIEYLTNMPESQRREFEKLTPKGQMFRLRLLEHSKKHMSELAAKMIDSHVEVGLRHSQVLYTLLQAFENILYEEYERRKKKQEMTGT